MTNSIQLLETLHSIRNIFCGYPTSARNLYVSKVSALEGSESALKELALALHGKRQFQPATKRQTRTHRHISCAWQRKHHHMSMRMKGSMLLLDQGNGQACIGEDARGFINRAELSGFLVIQFTGTRDISGLP